MRKIAQGLFCPRRPSNYFCTKRSKVAAKACKDASMQAAKRSAPGSIDFPRWEIEAFQKRKSQLKSWLIRWVYWGG
ncbi:MAG: hypothetical protein Q4A28_00130 [Brachymonas sp.]|nr:hypothetical protein [Brachymonas sp.]